MEEGPGRREAEARARKSHLFQLWVGACAVTAVFNVVTLGSRSVLVNRGMSFAEEMAWDSPDISHSHR